MKKYKLTEETINAYGRILYRIEAIISFSNVDAGEKGGFIEKEENLNHDGNAWVSDNARVSGNARVSDNAWVYGDARVYGDALVYGNAVIKNKGCVETKSYLTIGPVGGNRFITLEKSCGIVNAGCFSGSIDEFENAVREKYRENSDYYPVIELLKKVIVKQEAES